MLTLAAFRYHPALKVARAQWATARSGETTAAQRPNPALNVTPTYNTTTAVPSPWLPLGSLDWPIETAGKRRFRRAQAAHVAEAARLHIGTVAWQLRSNLRLAVLDFSAATAREQLLQRQLEVQDQLVKFFEQQVQAGARSSSEAIPFRIAGIRLRLDLADSKRVEAESRASVAEAIGVPLRALEQLTIAAPLTNAPVLELSSAEVRRMALVSRTDVLTALA
jgi:outer membrane protein TolC